MTDLNTLLMAAIASPPVSVLAKTIADNVRWRQDRADRIQRQEWLDRTMQANHAETLGAVNEVKDVTLSVQDRTDILRGLAEELGYTLTKIGGEDGKLSSEPCGAGGTSSTGGCGSPA